MMKRNNLIGIGRKNDVGFKLMKVFNLEDVIMKIIGDNFNEKLNFPTFIVLGSFDGIHLWS